MSLRRSAALFVPVLAACNPDQGFSDRKETDVWFQSPTDQVDILWVVDNSNSMQVEQTLLADGFGSFISEIENTGADFHLGVITTDFDPDDEARGQLLGSPAVITPSDDYLALFQERALVGLQGSGKEKGLAAAAYALSPIMTTGVNAGFLRQEANLLVVFVTDEEDCSDDGRLGPDADNTACYNQQDLLVPVADYVQRFQALKPAKSQVKLSGIVGPRDAVGLCDETTVPGMRYIQAAELTGGLTASICEGDWSSILYELGLNAAGIFTTFTMSHGAKPGTLVVKIDGDVVPESEVDGYTYLPELPGVEFHGIWIPERGAEITAEYVIQPGT